MPGLPDTMYCSEQICIPPTFPYLLRQYAKAAIRSQPTDLLRWSTAYFRCLSLNIPPPVKPRLEYPIPRSHQGITPGWLKALLGQLPSTNTVDFKVLWDRWIGACLEHDTLIQILCLGGFTNPMQIPWLRFLGLCAAHLTDDLTHSMILICEIFTEEPEGGNAMIPVDVFLDLYKFLASIDASQDQILKNYYFTDNLLALWKIKVAKFKKEIEFKDETDESSVTTEMAEEAEMEEEKKKSADDIISCPSIDQDRDDFLQFMDEGGEESDKQSTITDDRISGQIVEADTVGKHSLSEQEAEPPLEEETEEREEGLEGEEEGEEESEKEAKEDEPSEDKPSSEEDLIKEEPAEEELMNEEEGEGLEEEKTDEVVETIIAARAYESLDTLDGKPDFPDRTLAEDLKKLKALQVELAGETDEELEKYKCQLIGDMPMTSDQQMAIKYFQAPDSTTDHPSTVSDKDRRSEMPPEDDGVLYEDVWVPRVPGIGGVVPMALVHAVEDYMRTVACLHEGMVMPRDIIHYSCPPLECPIEEN
ncbi:unnamed protein product [Brassicogethes aeneus]|uniref:Ropporin-1-like protein n=1 Tax=Brassicogethes aeneus TaxID=1431903 RepID=A0A9P0FDX8_BRAAE|nr:unnamed protein product [Brassicogethes aeneus]